MMRIVLDSNILARPAVNSTGPAAEVLDRMQQPDHVLVAALADQFASMVHKMPDQIATLHG
jgi:hypothetical protein